LMLSYSMFFFFQAEDGIRDRNVTGVQTCALPILAPKSVVKSKPTSSEEISITSPVWCSLSPGFALYVFACSSPSCSTLAAKIDSCLSYDLYPDTANKCMSSSSALENNSSKASAASLRNCFFGVSSLNGKGTLGIVKSIGSYSPDNAKS